MFRRTPPSSEAVLAARRRLAALAAQFEHVSLSDEIDQPDGATRHTVVHQGSDQPDPMAEPGGPPRAGGRHAATIPSLRRTGWQLTPHHVTLTALVVAVVVAFAAWWVLRSASRAEPVQLSTQRVQATPSSGGETVTTGAPAPDPGPVEGAAVTTGTTDHVVVDVAGKVRHPGIVELPVGSRVVDAIAAAGGPRPGADTSNLNLARVLVDGEQLVVGLEIPQMAAAPSSPSTTGPAPVNLNTATPEQLETLPGIGPVTAAAIIEWRDEQGGFTSVDELVEVSGIGPPTLNRYPTE
jgi:competence protein ComEA